MGIVEFWKQDVIDCFEAREFNFIKVTGGKYDLIAFDNVVLNLVSLRNKSFPNEFIALQDDYKGKGIDCFNLWEDIWSTRKDQVLGRIAAIIGVNERIHARKTEIVTVTQQQADEFLIANHLQESAKAKYKFGLRENDRLVAVATFSNLRYMKNGIDGYRSAELIRFATLTGYTVTGGFSKLLKHFIKEYGPHDVMSYSDRDWSLGKAYEQAGFKLKEITLPATILLNVNTLVRFFPHRVSAEELSSDEYIQIFNTGNLKYLLYLHS
ncbi:hypothetical protein [Pedobacter frigoris]|uniref:hypothetical protein n=1 Tax=Pedobacter frigoris TaxID=2571272 RepID=UPI002930BA91|nr:hypothetical protein [Pedobacter frigoris]